MPAYDVSERGGIRETVAVHGRDPRHERRMMHEDDGRALARLVQARREPAQTLVAEQAADLAGHERVERHEPHRVFLDDVLHEPPAPWEVGMVGERGGGRVAVVVITRDEVDRHREWR